MRPYALGLVLLATGCKGGDDGLVVYNEPPLVVIVEPVDQSVFPEGDTITFLGRVSDDSSVEDLEVQWTSSVDGVLPGTDLPDGNGEVSFATANLTEGPHVITLRAFDEEGENGEASITITIDDVPELPSIQVVSPGVGDKGLENQPFVFRVDVSDEQDTPQELLIDMESNPGGFICWMVPDGGGHAQCDATLAIGQYLLTFTVEDTDGNVAQANAVYEVISPLDFDGDGDGVTPNGGDCQDSNETIYPGAPEVCDGLDNDCNSATGIDIGGDCYDDDGDGYCEQPPCVNAQQTVPDCNDTSNLVSPSAIEVQNGVDDNCDGRIDEGTPKYDDDGDGYCETPPCVNASQTTPDCNDGAGSVNPGAPEVCGDGLDNDCDSLLNEQNAQGCTNFYRDNDGDTYGVSGGTQCWCDSGTTGWTGVNTQDCYDSNANARPGQTQYFTSHRGDNSFDYNCNNTNEKQWQGQSTGCTATFAPFECDLNGEGWQGSQQGPACGNAASYIDECDMSYDAFCFFACTQNPALCTQCYDCGPYAESRTQACR